MPWVTIGIIAACTLVQIYSAFFAPTERDAERLLDAWRGVDPTAENLEEFTRQLQKIADGMPVFRFGYKTGTGFTYQLFTSLFVHDGWFHLVGNMLFLWLAGSAVEDRWGYWRFAIFYVVSGVIATFIFAATASSEVILVGASGAISAMMGAFLVHYYKTAITFWWFYFFRSGTFRAPAWVALPLWLGEQGLYAYLSRDSKGAGVAYMAHIGGFAFGFAAAFALRRFLPEDDPRDDERVYDTPAAPAAPVKPLGISDERINERYQQLVEAIRTKDIGTIRTHASRTILDLARNGDDGTIVDLYKEMAATLSKVPLTDGAFVAAATSADALNDRATFIAIAEAALAEHPGSSQVPKIMWRLAELRRDDGEVDAAVELLRTLYARFPRDTYGERAKQALDSRGLG